MISGRRYVSIEVDNQEVAAMLVSAGMAKAQDKRQGAEPLHDALIAAQEEP
jgi:endonuclease YncB( thermonuclease family)